MTSLKETLKIKLAGSSKYISYICGMNTSRKVNMVGRIQTTAYLLAPDTTHSFSSALLVSCNQLCFKLCNLAIQTLFPSLHCSSPIPNLLLVLHHLYTNHPANTPSCKAPLPPHAFIRLRQKVHITMCAQCERQIWLEFQTKSLIHIRQQRSWAKYMASTIGACESVFHLQNPPLPRRLKMQRCRSILSL